MNRRACRFNAMPQEPGRYFWSEWRCVVDVVKRGRKLYVTPPGGIEIAITPYIAGRFSLVEKD